MSAHQPPPALAQRLTLVIQTLRKIIAARAGRDRSVVALVLLAWPYLHRVARRFEALARRLQEGGAAPAPQPRPADVVPRPRPRQPPARLPRGFAWMIRLAPETAPLGGQLRHLLADPEFSALLAADGRAAKILRPLCRMLGVSPDPDLPSALFRPAAPRRSRASERPAEEPSAASSPAPDWPKPQPSPGRRGRRRLLWSGFAPA